MSYRNQYSGSPWQQGGPPFGVGGYGQSYGGYGINDQYAMMNSGYSRNQGGYSSLYGSGMSQMRSMGYGGPSPSRHYLNDRMGGRQGSRGQMQRKRLPQRSPAGGPRSKRPNLDSDSRRNRSKPRRRRDSRGGSKGRRDHSEDEKGDEPYNPAEPTDDASDINYDDYDSWKSSSDDEGESKGVTQNGDEQPAIDDEAKTKSEKTDESDKGKNFSAIKREVLSHLSKQETKKPLVCHVCKITCSSSERFRNHMSSRTHRSKMELLLALQREKKQGQEASVNASQQVDNRDSAKKGSRKPGNWCTVCECSFSGNFLAHRRTKEHRKKRDKKYPKCRPCRVGFSSSEEYREHCKKEDHKLKSAEFHYLKNLASGSDDDEAAIEPVKIEEGEAAEEEDLAKVSMGFLLNYIAYQAPKKKLQEEEKPDAEAEASKEDDKEKSEAKEGEETSDEKKEKKDSKSESKKPAKPKEPKAIGQSFVVSVQGYYCKLCHKFFKDVTVAKVKHCRSIMHSGAFKKAMEEAMEQEEERQKLAEEQEKVEREQAEASRLAAEIAAVEKAAKEAAKREAAEKKAAQKSKDVEMKESTEQTGGKTEITEDAGVANGDKDEMEVIVVKEDKDESEEAKVKSEPAQSVVVVGAVEEDKPAETAQSDSQGDEEVEEEPEKVKEEPTSSPATRRGRGRGRGQSRGKGKRR